MQILSSPQCRFLRRCSAGSDPTLLLKLVLWKLCGQRGHAGGSTFPLLPLLLPHECRINSKSSKAFCVLESKATFHLPHILAFLPSPHVWLAWPFNASVFILTSKHTDRLSLLRFCIIPHAKTCNHFTLLTPPLPLCQCQSARICAVLKNRESEYLKRSEHSAHLMAPYMIKWPICWCGSLGLEWNVNDVVNCDKQVKSNKHF